MEKKGETVLVYARETLANFLVQAKRQSYASQGDAASVPTLLHGSKQLEHQSGDYFYRDIYFGSIVFAGQEVVAFQKCPVWSMVYSGGLTLLNPSQEQVEQIYGFLRKALRLVNHTELYRGPKSFETGLFSYSNNYNGTIDNFRGHEVIELNNHMVYELHYSGGVLE